MRGTCAKQILATSSPDLGERGTTMDCGAVVNLVWDVADSASSLLTGQNRTRTFATLGAGDVDRASEAVFVEHANSPNLLCPKLAARVDKWIDCNVDRGDDRRLRSLLPQIAASAGVGDVAPPLRLATIHTRRRVERSAAS
jgi:hypothetical protein